MKIILNNNNEELKGNEMNIQQLLDVKKFTFKMLIIKINGSIVKREDYESTFIKDGDKVDVIHLISGGWNAVAVAGAFIVAVVRVVKVFVHSPQ